RPRRPLFPRGRSGARPRRGCASTGGRVSRPDPRRVLPRRALLVRPPRRDGPHGRRGATGTLGSRLGRRGDERRLDAAARRATLRRAQAAATAAALFAGALDRRHGHTGTVVAHGTTLLRRP